MDDSQKGLFAVSNLLGKSLSRRGLLAKAAMAGAAIPTISLLAACGGDDAATATTAAPAGGSTPAADATTAPDSAATEPAGAAATEPAAADATSAPTDSGTAEPEGRIVIMQGVDANTLDPLFRNSTPEFNVNLHIFDMFLRRNAETLEIEPGFIQTWEAIDDTTWHLTIPEGATFHNGDPADTDSVLFSFERAGMGKIFEKAIVHGMIRQSGFESASAIDEKTVEVKTSKPTAIFPALMTSFEVCPRSVYEVDSADALAALGNTPVGSGPYKFVEWQRDDHITLEANPDYWGEKPSIKTIIFRPVPELSARVIALQNEEAQVIVNVAPDVVSQIDSSATARVSSVTGGRIIFLGLRCDKEPFTDVRVRQALNYAIDFESIATALLAGNGTRAATIVNPPHQNPDLKPYPYDIEKAKELLAEAGVAPGTEITMDAPNGRYIKDSEMAQAIAQGFDDIGLKINLRVLEWSVYAGELLPSGNPDPIFFLGLGAPFTGEQELFYVHPDYSLNFTFWENAEFVELYDKLQHTIDPTERQDLMNQLQVIVSEECPWAPLWHQVDFYGVSKKLEWEARPDERIDVREMRYI